MKDIKLPFLIRTEAVEQLKEFDDCRIDYCDCHGDYVPIRNYNDGNNYLIITENGRGLICRKCNE